MKITNKINLNREEKTLSTPGGVKASGRKNAKSKKPVSTKDRAALIREKDENSSRKLGIIGEAKKVAPPDPRKIGRFCIIFLTETYNKKSG